MRGHAWPRMAGRIAAWPRMAGWPDGWGMAAWVDARRMKAARSTRLLHPPAHPRAKQPQAGAGLAASGPGWAARGRSCLGLSCPGLGRAGVTRAHRRPQARACGRLAPGPWVGGQKRASSHIPIQRLLSKLHSSPLRYSLPGDCRAIAGDEAARLPARPGPARRMACDGGRMKKAVFARPCWRRAIFFDWPGPGWRGVRMP